jgi:hypothetical protein
MWTIYVALQTQFSNAKAEHALPMAQLDTVFQSVLSFNGDGLVKSMSGLSKTSKQFLLARMSSSIEGDRRSATEDRWSKIEDRPAISEFSSTSFHLPLALSELTSVKTWDNSASQDLQPSITPHAHWPDEPPTGERCFHPRQWESSGPDSSQ